MPPRILQAVVPSPWRPDAGAPHADAVQSSSHCFLSRGEACLCTASHQPVPPPHPHLRRGVLTLDLEGGTALPQGSESE